MAELRCEGVAKSYRSRVVLSEVDLVVPEGTLTAILGASGSGKTTLLRLIIGFTEVDQGRIVIDGSTVSEAGRSHVAPEKRAIGYVAQEGALYPHLNVGDNVGFGLPRPERKAARRVGDLLDLVGLSADFARRRPHELSGGEQRRVALARALAPRPRLVLLDEPFSGLDPNLRADTRQAVLEALGREGATGVLVTHDQAEALSVGREVAVLHHGRLVQTAEPAALYTTPADLDVARFVGDAVVLPGRADSTSVRCALGTLPVLQCDAEGPVDVVVRPEQIEVRPVRRETAIAPGRETGENGTVTNSTFYGAQTVVHVTLDGGDETAVTAAVFSHGAPRVGDRVELVVAGPVMTYPSAQRVCADPGRTSNRIGSVGRVATRPGSGAHQARDGERIDPA
jgi:iron(III) transport system ATP-binding protein